VNAEKSEAAAAAAARAQAPRVAVIILQWGRSELTIACLQSLATLAYPDYTVLVVDNHSADGSVDRLRQKFPELAILENPQNLGFAGGCNAGIGAALADSSVEYVLLLNNDTQVPPDFLQPMVAAAEAAPATMAVGAINFCNDTSGAEQTAKHTSGGGRIDWWTGRYVDVLDERDLEAVTKDPVIEVDAVSGSSMLMRAAPLRRGELLDPAFFCMFEETDWCLRQRSRGGRVVLATGARIEHQVSGTMGKPLQFYFRFRNRPYFMGKHARTVHWLTFLPYYLVEAVARIMAYTLVGRGAEARAIFLGVLDAARGRRGPGRIDQLRS
jgi:GT2 family glycosyltransferase